MGGNSSSLHLEAAARTLLEEDVPTNRTDFWHLFFSTPATSETYFQLLKSDDVRKLLFERPGNLQTLLEQSVAELERALHPLDEPHKQQQQQQQQQQQLPRRAVNAARLLTRLLPFVYEARDATPLGAALWRSPPPAATAVAEDAQQQQQQLPVAPVAAAAAAAAVELNPLAGAFPAPAAPSTSSSLQGAPAPTSSTASPPPATSTATTTMTTPPSAASAAPPPSAASAASPPSAASAASPPSAASAASSSVADAITSDQIQASIPEGQPLGVRLVEAVMALLFTPDLTMPGASRGQLRPGPPLAYPLGFLWAGGLGCSTAPVPSAAQQTTRVELLKCLLAACCSTLYESPSDAVQVGNRALEHLVCSSPGGQQLTAACYYRQALFYSLLNVPLHHALESGGSWLPSVSYYAPLLAGSPAAEPTDQLADVSLQLLATLLHYEPVGGTGSGAQHDQSIGPQGSSSRVNEYSRLGSSRLESASELQWLSNAAGRLLQQTASGQSGYRLEMLPVLWLLLQRNPALLRTAVAGEAAAGVLVPLLHLLLDAHDDPTQLGSVHLAVFIVLLLSSERDFCVALNQPYAGRSAARGLPPLSHGSTHADLLVLTVARLLLQPQPPGAGLEPLHECLLTIVCNASAYIKALSMVASMRLLRLLEVFSRPRFLAAAARNHRYVSFVLETLNNLVQYQYEGNTAVVYAIVRSAPALHALAGLQLEQLRKPAAAAAGAGGAGMSAGGDGQHEMTSGEETPEEDTPDLPNSAPSAAVAAAASLSQPAADGSAATPALPSVDPLSPLTLLPDGPFEPTAAWLEAWKAQLPLSTCMRLVEALRPRIERLVTGRSLPSPRHLSDPPSCSPSSCLPSSCLPSSCLPSSCLPSSCLPSSCFSSIASCVVGMCAVPEGPLVCWPTARL
eukprot:TRINITY_DN856_c2_g1_i3.p1 TRINITY_DN856_c2_g1~~TRINITY_DN856_c2_g1_i3.p1  ORF type:complete len:908 (-),score=293.92 TRINITY_DN856_c2_g1_i3:71-2794(-)